MLARQVDQTILRAILSYVIMCGYCTVLLLFGIRSVCRALGSSMCKDNTNFSQLNQFKPTIFNLPNKFIQKHSRYFVLLEFTEL